MKKVLVLIIAVLFLLGFSCPVALHAKGGHGGGHGGGRGGGHGGYHGGHSGGFHGGGGHAGGGYHARYGHYGGYRSYGGYASYGWYGPGFFGGLYSDPWYYYEPPYYDPYSPPPASVYPEPALVENPENDSAETSGEWVEVPGQSVNGTWVPPHKAWVPESP